MTRGVGQTKAGSARRRARVRLMTKPELQAHEAGVKRLDAAFGDGVVSATAEDRIRSHEALLERLGRLVGFTTKARDDG